MNAAIILINPKTPYNVGAVIRACAIFDVPTLRWTGDRVHANKASVKAGTTFSKRRLPREERMKDYTQVDWASAPEQVIDSFVQETFTPVAVEVRDASEYLDEFVHPDKAVYVFGPEDGSLSKGVLAACHRFVRVRTANRTPLNLAMAANLVLYDRFIKEQTMTAELNAISLDFNSISEHGYFGLTYNCERPPAVGERMLMRDDEGNTCEGTVVHIDEDRPLVHIKGDLSTFTNETA